MVRIGFVVEGYCEKILLESSNFCHWAKTHNISICFPIINACGGGNLCPKNINDSITECKLLANPDKNPNCSSAKYFLDKLQQIGKH